MLTFIEQKANKKETMKALTLALTLFAYSRVQAGCYSYEYIELQSYSNAELSVMALEFEVVNSKMMEILGANMSLSQIDEYSNCRVQANRMRHIIDIRRNAPVKPNLK